MIAYSFFFTTQTWHSRQESPWSNPLKVVFNSVTINIKLQLFKTTLFMYIFLDRNGCFDLLCLLWACHELGPVIGNAVYNKQPCFIILGVYWILICEPVCFDLLFFRLQQKNLKSFFRFQLPIVMLAFSVLPFFSVNGGHLKYILRLKLWILNLTILNHLNWKQN